MFYRRTNIKGSNTTSQNLPVTYWCRMPFPNKNNPVHLRTEELAEIIEEYGPENVMLLAMSVSNEKTPLRVHVNELLQLRDHAGRLRFNFHVKDSQRGFENASVRSLLHLTFRL